MRLQRGVPIAGVDPELARTLVRACRGWAFTERVAHLARLPVDDAAPMLGRLADDGYLERRDVDWDGEQLTEWAPTLSGGALTMASFLKPIPRAKAEALLAGVLARAAEYNADPGKLYFITEIAAFGSYVRPDVTELGDLDLAVQLIARSGGPRPETEETLTYVRASGRSFPNFLAKMLWPETEVVQILRNRSGYINVHLEDISRFTDEQEIVYSHPGG